MGRHHFRRKNGRCHGLRCPQYRLECSRRRWCPADAADGGVAGLARGAHRDFVVCAGRCRSLVADQRGGAKRHPVRFRGRADGVSRRSRQRRCGPPSCDRRHRPRHAQAGHPAAEPCIAAGRDTAITARCLPPVVACDNDAPALNESHAGPVCGEWRPPIGEGHARRPAP